MNNKIFEITTKSFGNQQLLELRNNKTHEYVGILPQMGGMLFSCQLQFNNQLISILEKYSNEKELIDMLDQSYKGSLLAPFPNRIDGGKYNFNGRVNQLEINLPDENNAIHGLIYNRPFHIVSQNTSETSANLELKFISDGSLKGYPYKFELSIIYSLDELNGLSICAKVSNIDSVNIPFGIGWHPYFTFNTKINNLEFKLPSDVQFIVNNRMLPTGKVKSYNSFHSPSLIEESNFDTCFGLTEKSGIAETQIFDKELNIGFAIWQETGVNKYNYLQIYTPDSRNSIAIEPMTCIPNAFNTEGSFTVLEPAETSSTSWGVKKI